MKNKFQKYKGFIFDMDGTIYLENKMIEGAAETLNYLLKKKKHILFVTNKTTQNKNEYSDFLNSNNVHILPEQIITAADTCTNYLAKEKKGKFFYAIGEQVFISQIQNAGLTFTENPQKAEILLVTLDRNYSKFKFEIAKKTLENNAEFFAANIDNTCPVIRGEIIDAGIVISELEVATGKKLQNHFGKPSKFMISEIKKRLIYNPEEYILIGDRLETDIFMGNNIGMDTALVKSGVSNKLANSTFQSTFTINSIQEILNGK